jgi:rhodanese-related sulfurtransferase
MGYTDVSYMTEGIIGWKEMGLPIERSEENDDN